MLKTMIPGVCIVGAVLVPVLSARGQTELWKLQLGSGSDDIVWAMAGDGAGGMFAAGDTWGALGAANAGFCDAWLARYDSFGNQTWIRQFGSGADDGATAAASDGAGGVFVGGHTDGILAGSAVGSYDAWLARYDAAGDRVWIRQFGSSVSDWVNAATADGAGGVFVTGVTGGSFAAPNAGLYDAWVARYDAAGNQAWVRQFGTSGDDQAMAIAADGAGGFYVAGWTDGGLGGTNSGSYDAWLARYDGAGNRTWIRQFGTDGDDSAMALGAAAGGVFVGGSTNGTMGSTSAGGIDAWIALYDASGTRTWIRQFGTSDDESVSAAAGDGAGGVFLGGWTTGGLAGSNAGYADAWLARYDAAGNRAWINQSGTVADDGTYAVLADGAGGAFAGGGLNGSLGGDPYADSYDAWLGRWGQGGCYANCDASTVAPILNANDFQCFLNRFAAGDAYANCDGSTVAPILNANDFQCFLNGFAAGCN